MYIVSLRREGERVKAPTYELLELVESEASKVMISLLKPTKDKA